MSQLFSYPWCVYRDDVTPHQYVDIVVPRDPPAGRAPLAGIVHAGAWTAGSKDDTNLQPLRDALWARGIATATMNYRLLGEAAWPAMVEDVERAVAWICARATYYNIDPTRVALLGVSAGAHLAAMATLRRAAPILPPRPTLRDKLKRLLGAPAPFPRNTDGPGTLFYRAMVGVAGAYFPQTLAGQSPNYPWGVIGLPPEATPAPPIPPGAFLVVHGDADPIVNVRQALDFHMLVGGSLWTISGGDHGSFIPSKAAEIAEWLAALL